MTKIMSIVGRMSKVLPVALVTLITVSAYAEEFKVSCHIQYASANGTAKIDTFQIVELAPFTFKNIPVGNLSLNVYVGGEATIADGAKSRAVSVEIFDNYLPIARDGDITVNPLTAAEAAYQVEGSKESLSASCSLAK